MKKIHLLLLQAFLRPFVVTFLIVMFILLMFFLFKYIDDLIGKGFEWYVIVELMFYASASNVAMALPLAVLLSSIMTFGSLGENYELVAIKSAGISLQKAMRPLLALILLLSVASFLFSDYMLPKANLKFGSLMWDVRNKKLSFLIKEGVFNNSIPGYAIRVDRKDSQADSLFGVTIYDHTGNSGIAKVIKAEKGRMYKLDGDKYLYLKLINGVRYEESSGNSSTYNPRQQFSRMRFRQTEQKFDLSTFALNRTAEESFSNNTQMQNLKGLVRKRDSLQRKLDSLDKSTKYAASSYFKQTGAALGYSKISSKPKKLGTDIVKSMPKTVSRYQIYQSAADRAESIRQSINNRVEERKNVEKDRLFTIVEYQRKYTLAVSCLLLFFIGAPLGAIIRKGGLGLPVVMAISFFLVYHVISTVAEKSAREGSLDPRFGMWLAIIILSPLGAFLTYKATADSALFDVDYYKNLVKGLFKKKVRG
ncbi:permease [Pedobacter yulinensis]|uniref:Permease n=1 Tax=Pedobacter yulinensis TaxID=2126353 RepID=A0A2T3HJ34_9SPHI|nr:LptF/LptG family permease [Pedobacter yulinensis]PST82413.1 permease [Pedobacter yulinensis]